MTFLVALAFLVAAQQPPVPRPFPQPGSTTQRPPAAPDQPPPPQAPPARTEAAQPPQTPAVADAAPSEATLGVPVYPGAQFITSYDAGRGQRFYLFGTTATFEIGKFDDDTMAFPPGVTIKDFQSSLSGGYPNPDLGGEPKQFPTIIQIVPVPPQ